jgi:hypothetical protein
MNWNERLLHGFTINGVNYSVKHLNEFIHSYEIKSLGRILNCHIRFSGHCCTEEADSKVSPAMHLNDRGAKRRFSFERYHASKHLVELIKNIHNVPLRKDKGGSSNALLVELNLNGTTDVYKIFLNVKKNQQKGVELSMYVETAHIQYSPTHPKYRSHTAIHSKADLDKLPKISGGLYLANIFQNKPIVFKNPR